MATSLYLLNADGPLLADNPPFVDGLLPDWQGSWDKLPGSTFATSIDIVKDGNINSADSNSENVATSPYRVAIRRTVSKPLAAQTISGTLDVILGVQESNADADFYFKIYAYILNGSTYAVRHVLLDYEEGPGTGTEWPTTSTGRALDAPASLTSGDAEAGDFLVIEYGFVSHNTHTTSRTGTIRYGAMTANFGDTQQSDLTVGSTSTTTLAGSFVFSGTISFLTQPNDDCAAATAIASLPYASGSIENTRARREFSGGVATEPHPSSEPAGARGEYNSLWWKWTAPVTGNYNAAATLAVLEPDDNLPFIVLSIWTGSCGSFSEVASADASDGDVDITFTATGSTEYYFMVSTSFWGDQGTCTFALEALGSPPPNASCSTAETISSLPFTDTTDTTDDLSDDPDDPEPSLFQSIWYQWTAPATMYVRARTLGSDINARVAVYSGACGSLTEITRSTGNTDYAVWLAQSGTTYRLAAGGVLNGGGSVVVTVEELPNPASIEAGVEFTFGHKRRTSTIHTPSPTDTMMMAAYRPPLVPGSSSAPSISERIVSLHWNVGTAVNSGGVWIQADWRLTVFIGDEVATPAITTAYNDPHDDPLLGSGPDDDDLQEEVDRESVLPWHNYALQVRTSSYDPNTGLFSSDGYVSVWVNGTKIGEVTNVLVPQRLSDGSVRLALRIWMDIDAVWVAPGLAVATSYDDVGRPVGIALAGFWVFEGDRTGWTDWGPVTPGFPSTIYQTPRSGYNASIGLSAVAINANELGSIAGFSLYPGIYTGPLTLTSDDEGTPGPIAWVEWPRQVI